MLTDAKKFPQALGRRWPQDLTPLASGLVQPARDGNLYDVQTCPRWTQ